MDARVVDAQGNDIGDISEVVIDLQKDRVHAVVLESGGFMGLGGEQFAFPMSELKPGKEQNQFVMDINKQKLESAEGFAKGKMPGMDDQYWSRVGGERRAPARSRTGERPFVRNRRQAGARHDERPGARAGEEDGSGRRAG